jgi:uncharacterized protein with PQ loop repeat
MFIYILGWIGSISDVCSSLPQLWKCRNRMTTQDLSIQMIILRIIGALCWSIWAFYHQTLSLLLCHSVTFFVEVLLFFCILRDQLYPINNSLQ